MGVAPVSIASTYPDWRCEDSQLKSVPCPLLASYFATREFCKCDVALGQYCKIMWHSLQPYFLVIKHNDLQIQTFH